MKRRLSFAFDGDRLVASERMTVGACIAWDKETYKKRLIPRECKA